MNPDIEFDIIHVQVSTQSCQRCMVVRRKLLKQMVVRLPSEFFIWQSCGSIQNLYIYSGQISAKLTMNFCFHSKYLQKSNPKSFFFFFIWTIWIQLVHLILCVTSLCQDNSSETSPIMYNKDDEWDLRPVFFSSSLINLMIFTLFSSWHKLNVSFVWKWMWLELKKVTSYVGLLIGKCFSLFSDKLLGSHL